MKYVKFTVDGVSLFARSGQVAYLGRHVEVRIERQGQLFTARCWGPGEGEGKSQFSGTAREVAAWVNKKGEG